MHILIFPVRQWFVHQTSWLFSCLFFSQKPPETHGFARCFRDVSSMHLQRSVTSMARIPRTDAALGHCPFCTERFARWPHVTWDCDGTPQNEIQKPVRFHHYLSWRFSWAVKSQSETGRIAVLHWLMCARKSGLPAMGRLLRWQWVPLDAAVVDAACATGAGSTKLHSMSSMPLQVLSRGFARDSLELTVEDLWRARSVFTWAG